MPGKAKTNKKNPREAAVAVFFFLPFAGYMVRTTRYINSIHMYGRCASFSPFRENTGVWHSLLKYGFRCFFVVFFYFMAIVKGVLALNVVCLKG